MCIINQRQSMNVNQQIFNEKPLNILHNLCIYQIKAFSMNSRRLVTQLENYSFFPPFSFFLLWSELFFSSANVFLWSSGIKWLKAVFFLVCNCLLSEFDSSPRSKNPHFLKENLNKSIILIFSTLFNYWINIFQKFFWSNKKENNSQLLSFDIKRNFSCQLESSALLGRNNC